MTSEIWSINRFISFISQTASSRTPKYRVTMPYYCLNDCNYHIVLASLINFICGWCCKVQV